MSKTQQHYNILFITPTLNIGGGAEKVVANLSISLQSRGHEITTATFYKNNDMYKFAGQLIEFNEDDSSNIILRSIRQFQRAKKVAQIVADNDIDIIFSHLAEPNFSSILAKKIFGTTARVVCVSHNNPHKQGSLYKLIKKILYPYADKLITVSKKIRDIFKSDFGLANVAAIYNPINVDEITAQSKEDLTPKEERYFQSPVLISVGSMTHQKAQWHLLRSFAYITENIPEAKLVILGDGPLRGRLEKLAASLQLGDSVYMPGNVENPFKYIARSNTFVLSSLWEGLPMVLLEAFTLGVPMVSTDCETGPREIIAPTANINDSLKYPAYSDYGILTEKMKDEANFQNLTKSPLDDEEKMLGDACIALIKKERVQKETNDRFSITEITDQWEDIMDNA